MAILGILLAVVGGIGTAWYGLFWLVSASGIITKKIAPNQIKDEYAAKNSETFKSLSYKVISGLVALGIGLIIIHFTK